MSAGLPPALAPGEATVTIPARIAGVAQHGARGKVTLVVDAGLAGPIAAAVAAREEAAR